ncbi:sensor histidine kinase [Cohnella lubricantis]|uniref:histidine kinase n=1 Tax=Cohnella lubricantis TaxID=2163172 RepID=A0A841TAL7_9BACL|nr:sensor histidine kinase [Cohnella lubricantis]MBB6677079.1 sensor histidine kinase [Cohnella lubricantis]MBP2118926.1 sensor histidine kinase YesM [Cohnella lubricantis]
MGRTITQRTYIPYTYKMMISYLILVLVTDIVIGYISYTMLIRSRTEIAETNIRTGIEQTRDNLKYQLDEIQRISDTLFGNVPFQRALEKRGDPFEIYLTMIDDIVPQMRAPLQLFGNPLRIILYTSNGDLNIVEGDDLSTPIQDSDYYILSSRDIAGSEWLRTVEAGDDNRWMQIETDNELANISHIRRMVSFNGYLTVSGYLRITASFADLLGNFETFPVQDGITIRLADVSSETVLYQQGSAVPSEGTADYLTLTQEVPGTDFVIETLVSYDYLRKDARQLQKAIFAICSISFLVMALIGIFVARLSGRKMGKIVSLVRSFESGSFEKRVRFGGNDEFSRIGEAFNAMAANIQELISNVYVQGIQRKQAELEALQAQINPHFLYNSLSTISSLANLGETKQVTAMVKELSKFYRLSLNQGQVHIPLGKELEQVEAYLDIQRVKYEGAFSVHIDVDPDILDIPVIKLILQPFVENVFKHAWFGDTIAIRITGRRAGDNLELKVIDNGVGMRPDVVKTLLAGEGQEGGYGLQNVNERIKLRYGSEYGIEIGSMNGGGTAVRIVLPAEHARAADEA